MNAVCRSRNTLVAGPATCLILGITGIEEVEGVLVDDGATRIDPVLIEPVIRLEGNRQLLIGHEVLGSNMTPVFGRVIGRIRVILVENMIVTLEIAEPVRVIE